MLLGLGGVAVLIGPGAFRHLGASTLGELAIVGAAVSYAFAGTYGRRYRALPAVVPVAGMLTTSALMALPAALALDRPWTARPSGAVVGALLGLALLSTALGFLIYFRLLSSVGATNVMLVTLLIPVTALLLGSLVLGERVTAAALAGPDRRRPPRDRRAALAAPVPAAQATAARSTGGRNSGITFSAKSRRLAIALS